jgi:hypothetical protein
MICRVIVTLAVGMMLGGCTKNSRVCESDLTSIRAKTPQVLLSSAVDALTERGMVCERKGGIYVCEGRDTGSLNVFMTAEHAPERLTFSAPFRMKVPCEQAAPVLNKVNLALRMAVVTCERKTLFVDTTLLIPHAGFTRRELFDYLAWWSDQVRTGLERIGAMALMEGDPHDAPMDRSPDTSM